MDIRKIWLIVWKDLRIQFADSAGILISYVTPVVLTLIISLAFSNIGGGGNSSPITDIPIVIVNQDAGGAFGKLGDQVASLFLAPPESLAGLIDARAVTTPEEARQIVLRGEAQVAILIPADFSASLNTANPDFGKTQKVRVEIFRNVDAIISGQIVASIVNQFVNSVTNASIAISAAAQTNPILLAQSNQIASEVAEKTGAENNITVTVTEGKRVVQQRFNALQQFAPSMAVFFLNFSVAFGVLSVMEEKERWTLQRMLISPTARPSVLIGKLGGAYINGVVQLTILIVATTVLGLLLGNPEPVWGTDVIGLAVMVLVVVAASIGLGTIIVGLAKDRVQAQVLINAIMIVLGLLGGAFFANASGGAPLGPVSYISMNYWAQNAFTQLTQGVFPALNIVVLGGMFIGFFGVGLVLFNRRVGV